jgi:adenylosuccinate synthase
MTDHLVEHADVPTAVVCFNGGAQAGHTVMRDGMRHVFGHFGAGSLQGATTYLSKFFVVNPMLFVKEHSELITKGVMPKVIIDGDCIVTTPYDMLMNQLLEAMRGANRHGSCGVGFGETIDRAEKAPSSTLYARDLQNVAHLLQGIDREVNVHYMTRAYRTRHGAGPLQHEGKSLPKVSDLSNFKNEFQGSLRFAPLDIDELLTDIMRDVSLHSNGLQARYHVCVTCMDQLNNGSVDVVLNGKVEMMEHSRMLAELNRLPSLSLLAVSNGSKAKDIEYV